MQRDTTDKSSWEWEVWGCLVYHSQRGVNLIYGGFFALPGIFLESEKLVLAKADLSH